MMAGGDAGWRWYRWEFDRSIGITSLLLPLLLLPLIVGPRRRKRQLVDLVHILRQCRVTRWGEVLEVVLLEILGCEDQPGQMVHENVLIDDEYRTRVAIANAAAAVAIPSCSRD